MPAVLKKTVFWVIVIAIVLVVVAGRQTAVDFGNAVGNTIDGLGGFFSSLWESTVQKWINERGGGGTLSSGVITLPVAVQTTLTLAA